MAAEKRHLEHKVLQELYRLHVEEGWDCQRLTTLCQERYGITISRPTLFRRLSQLVERGGVLPTDPGEPPIMEDSGSDEVRLDRVIRDLYRTARVCAKQGEHSAQVQASKAFGQLLLVRRKLQEPLPPVPVGSTVAPALPASTQQPQVMTQEQLAAELAGELG